MKFIDGETYRFLDDDEADDVFVLAVDEETEEGVYLAVLFTKRDDINDTTPGELFIPIEEYEDWELLEIE